VGPVKVKAEPVVKAVEEMVNISPVVVALETMDATVPDKPMPVFVIRKSPPSVSDELSSNNASGVVSSPIPILSTEASMKNMWVRLSLSILKSTSEPCSLKTL